MNITTIGSNQHNTKFKKYIKVGAILFLVLAVICGIGAYKVNQFFENHSLVFQKPISFHKPVYLTKREKTQIITQVKADENISPLTSNQQYLCNKFAKDCKVMLAIQKAENTSGDCEAINIHNKNGSVDFGFLQINSIHLKKGYSKKQLLDCNTNIDIAYEIFKASGFKPWVTYNNGSYKKHLIN